MTRNYIIALPALVGDQLVDQVLGQVGCRDLSAYVERCVRLDLAGLLNGFPMTGRKSLHSVELRQIVAVWSELSTEMQAAALAVVLAGRRRYEAASVQAGR